MYSREEKFEIFGPTLLSDCGRYENALAENEMSIFSDCNSSFIVLSLLESYALVSEFSFVQRPWVVTILIRVSGNCGKYVV